MRRSIDIHAVLSTRKLQIAQRREALLEEYKRDLQQLKEEEERIDAAFEVLTNAVQPYLCKRCHGSGTVSGTVRVCDAAGDFDDDVCPVCHGTGVRQMDGGQDDGTAQA